MLVPELLIVTHSEIMSEIWKEENSLADFWSKISKQSKEDFSKTFSTISRDIQQGHEVINTEFSSKSLDALQNLSDRRHHVSMQIVPEHETRRVVTLNIYSALRHPSSTYILDWKPAQPLISTFQAYVLATSGISS